MAAAQKIEVDEDNVDLPMVSSGDTITLSYSVDGVKSGRLMLIVSSSKCDVTLSLPRSLPALYLYCNRANVRSRLAIGRLSQQYLLSARQRMLSHLAWRSAMYRDFSCLSLVNSSPTTRALCQCQGRASAHRFL